MQDKIIYAAANILMVVEAAAVIFLLWAWKKAARERDRLEQEQEDE